MHLPDRLRVVAAMVPPGLPCLDIGTDHARLPIELVRAGQIPRAIAADRRAGPLGGARANVKAAGLSDAIDVRASDGFDALGKDEAGVATLAGMGGENIAEVVVRGKPGRLGISTMVIQANTDHPLVRQALWQEGWNIVDERLCVDAGRVYLTILACLGLPGAAPNPGLAEVMLGAHLPKQGGPLVLAWLAALRDHLCTRQAGLAAGGADSEELSLCQELIDLYENAMAALAVKK